MTPLQFFVLGFVLGVIATLLAVTAIFLWLAGRPTRRAGCIIAALFASALAACATPDERHRRAVLSDAESLVDRCYTDLTWRKNQRVQDQCRELAVEVAGGPGCATGEGFRCLPVIPQVEDETELLRVVVDEEKLGGDAPTNTDP